MTIVPWMLCRLDWSDKHTPKIVTSGRNKSSPHSPGLIYRGDGVDGVHDCEQKDVVDTSGIVWVSRSGDLLTGGVVYEGWVAGDVHLVVCGVGYGCGWTVHVLILHQRLALVWHHHHITETNRWYLHQTFVYDETIQNKSLYSFFFPTHLMAPNSCRASTRSASVTPSTSPRTWTTTEGRVLCGSSYPCVKEVSQKPGVLHWWSDKRPWLARVQIKLQPPSGGLGEGSISRTCQSYVSSYIIPHFFLDSYFFISNAGSVRVNCGAWNAPVRVRTWS